MYDQIVDAIKEAPLFAGMSTKEIKVLITSCNVIDRKKGFLFSQKALDRSLFIPLNGAVKSYQINPVTSKEYILFLFTSGQIFDVITFVDERQHEVLFETVEDTRLLEIPHRQMNRWIEENPQINKNLIYLLSGMLQNLEQNASDLALYDTVTRLARLIFRNLPGTQLLSQSDSEKVKLKLLSLSHENIAQMIGSVREVVSRSMKTLKNEQVIETDAKKRRLIDLRSLLDFIKK